MVKLDKGDEPHVLVKYGKRWTEELLRKLEKGERISDYLLTRYAHPDVKAALVKETNGKCAYCESPFTHVTYGDVEHITPKSLDERLRFVWTNLTIACDVCNQNKSNYTGLLDPYECEPRELFEYFGPLMWAVHSHESAQLTEELLDLNRAGLLERRRERLEYIRRLVDSANAKVPAVRDAMLKRAWKEVESSKPFSACSREMLCRLLPQDH